MPGTASKLASHGRCAGSPLRNLIALLVLCTALGAPALPVKGAAPAGTSPTPGRAAHAMATPTGQNPTKFLPPSMRAPDPSPAVPGQPDGAASPGPELVVASNWANVFPDLYGVSAVSANDAWAVGEYGHVAHYTAGTWQAVDPPALSGTDLWDIKMTGPDAGWIPAGSAAYAYDGTSWLSRSNGLGPSPGLRVGVLAPLGSSDVWGTGRANGHDTLVHWDGTTWTAAGPVLDSSVYLFDITMTSPGEGWAVGEQSTGTGYQGVVLHYDGSTWTVNPGPPGATSLYSVSAPIGGSAWVVGLSGTSGRIYHFGAGGWTTISPPDGSQPLRIYMLNDAAGWVTTDGSILHWDGSVWTSEYTGTGATLQGLAGVGGQVWAVGSLDTILSRTGGGQWQHVSGGPTNADLHAAAAVSPTEAWAVGDNGTAVHYAGGTWQTTNTGVGATLNAVQMVAPADGYAAGGDYGGGVILHWDGSQWTTVATPPTPIRGLAMVGSGEGWAVGDIGIIWHDSGGTWAQVSSPTGTTLDSVAMDSPQHGWAVGGGLIGDSIQPVLLEYTGGQWVDRTAALPAGAPALAAVAVANGGAIGWAVGNSNGSGPVLQLNDGVWSVAAAPAVADLHAIAPEALGEAWAVGCAAYHYAGGAWQAEAFPTNTGYCLSAVALVPGQGGWAVGTGGKILRYNPLAPGQRFYDVPPDNPFFSYVAYMAGHGIISGYSDNTFRPYNNITRGQLTKMVALGMGWDAGAPPSPTFADVTPDNAFYGFVEAAAAHGIISGYTCGGPDEPCDAQNRPYFRPGAAVTRAQLAKIIVGAKGWGPIDPGTPPFNDVAPGDPFYGFTAQAAAKGIVNGYTCGGDGEPCPGAYYRPGAPATRGQLSKILYLALNQP